MLQFRPFDEPDEPAVVALWAGAFGYSDPHRQPASMGKTILTDHAGLAEAVREDREEERHD
jgi:hypothetical protein